MADDIVNRLREMSFGNEIMLRDEAAIRDAADEIERLRATVDAEQQAHHHVMWNDTLIPLAHAVDIRLEDDDGVGLRHFQAVDAIVEEAERLRRWKAEATEVIAGWDAVWEAARRPGVLGQPKSLGVLGELGRLDDEIARLCDLIVRAYAADADLQAGHPDPVKSSGHFAEVWTEFGAEAVRCGWVEPAEVRAFWDQRMGIDHD